MHKKYPFTKQNGLKDCAAASIQMIIKYYKGFMSIDKLNELLKTSRKGTTAYHIVETLKEIGFEAKGINLDKLKKTKIPFIANVIINHSYKHYLVVYEVNNKYILIADPNDKIKKISHEKFYQIWTGVILTMYPIKPLPKQNQHQYKFLIKMLKPYKFIFTQIWFLSLVVITFSIVSSFFFQALIDDLNKSINQILMIGIVFLIIFIIKSLSDYLRNHLLIKFTNSFDHQLTKHAFNQVTRLPYNYYQNHTTGEVISRIDDLSSVRDIISKIGISIFIDLPLTILSGVLLFFINKKLFIVVIIIFLIYLLILLIFKKTIKDAVFKVRINKAEVTSYMVEAIKGFETIKGLNVENHINKKFQKKYRTLISSNQKLNKIINNKYLINEMVNNIGQTLILIVGVILVKNGSLTLGALITYNILINLFLQPVRNIVDLDFELKQASSALERVKELFVEIEEKKIKENGKIEIKNLSYSFDDINLVLKNISLEIEEQKKVLITGKSGSGKSTLLKIIKGYYNDYHGQVLIGGQDIKDSLLKINYINQKELLFTGTITDNLILKGSKFLSKRKKVCFTDEIFSKDDLGYNALLEEDGFNISGGQRQRIVLARSLVDFDILIIDEGLNQLDIDLERKILKNLFSKYKNKTIIIISHRIDNLDLFDQYIKIKDGSIFLNEERSVYDKILA